MWEVRVQCEVVVQCMWCKIVQFHQSGWRGNGGGVGGVMGRGWRGNGGGVGGVMGEGLKE